MNAARFIFLTILTGTLLTAGLALAEPVPTPPHVPTPPISAPITISL